MKHDGTPHGVKKIDDLGVFSITATWSVLAYIWLFTYLDLVKLPNASPGIMSDYTTLDNRFVSV